MSARSLWQTWEDGEESPWRVCGDLKFDLKRFQLSIKGRRVRVSKNEFRLLSFLAIHPHLAHTRQMLRDRLWAKGGKPASGNIEDRIHRLRKKIEPDPDNPIYLRTVWGMAYSLAPLSEDACKS